ncbi:MocR-like pyridoxine biosynthesis transcription factor PdxR [Geomonas subterranea]|uniref:PLP-dependent aminotransferase family protein n=1 Tax=Geomonas subterranea TaxID=2847989 RepID=A0ABX8LF43_9BACT|nr:MULTISPECIES: PLP-dependent aminotransferase family protein [Geomonas]QXE90328.1 PLP-dependent aminotransferase family protein [Geomonas subterranea]QXM07547.1 PLP-dependent aminotransferase family protein [Geomonas subterranea]
MIYLNPESKKPLYQQLYEQLKQNIITGEYEKGSRLTSTRDLAKNLSIARNTVEAAYDQLCIEGYVEGRHGSGYVVQDLQEDLLYFPDMTGDVEDVQLLSSGGKTHEPEAPPPAQARAVKYNFSYGDFDPHSFPHALWRRLNNEVLTSMKVDSIAYYGDKQGELQLRRELTKYLRQSRGVKCSPDQIVVGAGLQDLAMMICLLFPQEERILGMEEPGYDFTRVIFANHGYRVLPVPVGESGIDPAELKKSGARLAYVTPSHQLPTGVVMPIQHRMRLLQWAEQSGGVIIEDDYDSEFRYRTRPIPALQSIDRQERVIYLGTFSKAFAPGLRMGYMVLPRWLLSRYHTVFERYKCTVPRLQQYVAASLLSGGHWDRHLRKVCLVNKKKHEVLVQSIQREMGDRVRIYGSNAGLHVLLEHFTGETQEAMVERAAAYQVKVSPTRQFWHNPDSAPENLIMIGFGGLSAEEIAEGIKLLRQAWFG